MTLDNRTNIVNHLNTIWNKKPPPAIDSNFATHSFHQHQNVVTQQPTKGRSISNAKRMLNEVITKFAPHSASHATSKDKSFKFPTSNSSTVNKSMKHSSSNSRSIKKDEKSHQFAVSQHSKHARKDDQNTLMIHQLQGNSKKKVISLTVDYKHKPIGTSLGPNGVAFAGSPKQRQAPVLNLQLKNLLS